MIPYKLINCLSAQITLHWNTKRGQISYHQSHQFRLQPAKQNKKMSKLETNKDQLKRKTKTLIV
jgi:cell division protein FtsB